jgi:glycosyltransferase involved in cell wall biosynthesis
MHIAFIHDSKSFLPEIAAYTQFFSSKDISCEVIHPRNLRNIKPDVYWHFMGTDRQQKPAGAITIHEYTSASVPPAAGLKNLYKRVFHTKPDYRLFLNEFTKAALGFSDGVPWGYRDMGIPASWLEQRSSGNKKTHDFIYVGELRNRGIESLLNAFATGRMRERTLLIVSKDYDAIRSRYAAASNISFTGPMPHNEVRSLMEQSRFAINFVPGKAPFSRQTSTKLLEYAACKVPVITSDYYWVRHFQEQHGGSFFYLGDGLSNFNWEQVQDFSYGFPDLSAWTWEQQILRSGVVDFLAKRFPGQVS